MTDVWVVYFTDGYDTEAPEYVFLSENEAKEACALGPCREYVRLTISRITTREVKHIETVTEITEAE